MTSRAPFYLPVFLAITCSTTACRQELPPATALEVAIFADEEARAIALIRAHPNLATQEVEPKSSFLHLAAIHNMSELIEILANLGANVNEKDGVDETPLFLAAQFGSIEAISALVRAGADVNACNWDGSSEDTKVMAETPLGRAVGRYELEAAALLVKSGASLTVPAGVSPVLHSACTRNRLPATPEKARQLVALWQEWGGDLEVVGPTGKTPLEYARIFGCQPMIDALESALGQRQTEVK